MFRYVIFACSAAIALAGLGDSLFEDPNHPAIEYRKRAAQDPVAKLSEKLRQGSVRLERDKSGRYMPAVLKALEIPVESQIAIFSKTSVQMARIEPRNPRTLFFNDSVVAGFVEGGFIELAAQDPQQGVIFYTLDAIGDAPALVRSDSCLSCHETYASLGVPGVFLRSVFPTANGVPNYDAGSTNVDHRTPFADRWGGYYLTGKSGPRQHRANATLAKVTDTRLEGRIVPSLSGRFDTARYLSPYSDVVALMVFDHQMNGMNLLTRSGWEIRAALYEQRNKSGRRDLNALLRSAAEEVADYLLFIDEAPLDQKVAGSSGFAEKFAVRGPFDKRGRSLREFDLETRLFRYPLSYLVYTPAFDALPQQLRQAIYARLKQIFSGSEKAPRYSRLNASTRQAILEILTDTKPDFR